MIEYRQVTVEQLLKETLGGPTSVYEIEAQMAAKMDAGDGWKVHHRDRHYSVSRASIQKYVETHERPAIAVTKDEYIDQQKKRIQELEALLGQNEKSVLELRDSDPLGGALVPSKPYSDPSETQANESSALADRMTTTQIQNELARSLSGKKPKSLKDITPSSANRTPVKETNEDI